MSLRIAAPSSGSSSKRGWGKESAMDPREVYTLFLENSDDSGSRPRFSTAHKFKAKLTSRLEHVGCQIAVFINKDIDFYVVKSRKPGHSNHSAASSSGGTSSLPASMSGDHGDNFFGAVGSARRRLRPATKTSSRSHRLMEAAGASTPSDARRARTTFGIGQRRAVVRAGVRQRESSRDSLQKIKSYQARKSGRSVTKTHKKFLNDNGITEIDEQQVLIYLEARERLFPRKRQRSSVAGNWSLGSKYPVLNVQDVLAGHALFSQIFKPTPKGRSSVPSLNQKAVATVSPFCPHMTERTARVDGYMQLYVGGTQKKASKFPRKANLLNMPWWLEDMCIKKRRRLVGRCLPPRKGRKRLAAGNWCECCSCSYTDLEEHCKGSQHLKFQENGLAFADVDDFLDQLYEEKSGGEPDHEPLPNPSEYAVPATPSNGSTTSIGKFSTPQDSGLSIAEHDMEASPTETKHTKRKKSRIVETRPLGTATSGVIHCRRESPRLKKSEKLVVETVAKHTYLCRIVRCLAHRRLIRRISAHLLFEAPKVLERHL